MVSGDLNNDGDDEIVVALTSAIEGSGSQADLFRVDSTTCFRLECLELVGNFAFTLPGGPTLSASEAAAVEGIIDATTTTMPGSGDYTVSTTRSPEIKLAIGPRPPLSPSPPPLPFLSSSWWVVAHMRWVVIRQRGRELRQRAGGGVRVLAHDPLHAAQGHAGQPHGAARPRSTLCPQRFVQSALCSLSLSLSCQASLPPCVRGWNAAKWWLGGPAHTPILLVLEIDFRG